MVQRVYKRGSIKSKTWKRYKDIHISSYKNPFFNKKISVLNKLPVNLFIFILTLVDLFLIIYFIFFSNFFIIKNFEIYNAPIYIKQKIFSLIKNQLNEKRFYIFPENNIFIFNTNKLKNNILNILPYQQVSIKKDKAKIKIILKNEPTAITLMNDRFIYLLDTNGYIIQKNKNITPKFENNGNLEYTTSILLRNNTQPLIYEKANSNLQIGNKVTNQNFINKIILLNKEFKKLNLNIVSFKILNLQAPEIQINTKNIKVLMNIQQNIKNLKKDILRLKILVQKNLDVDKIKYIDLRNNEKIFYK